MTLNKEQQRVYEWLNNDLSLPVFAAAYKGAAFLLNQQPAGYVSFVAHTGRDMMNYLAAEISGIKSGSRRVDYVEHINGIQIDWQDEWQFSDDLSPEVFERGHLIPIEVCQKISILIEDHKSGQEREADKVALFFSTFLDYSDKDKIPGNFISEWKAAKRWFGAHAHLRKGIFREDIHRDLVKHFTCLDGYLYIAASSQYERLKEINEILDATNQ
jgi:hypothetical protein